MQQASLFPNMPSFESIFTQISSGRVKRVESSLNSGFPINFSDPTGTTLLMTACRCEQRRIVEVLVTRGADVNLQNELGNTALHICFLVKESEHIADFLIAHGADDTIKNFEDLTAYEVLPE
jgi:ankyrin repeat protein